MSKFDFNEIAETLFSRTVKHVLYPHTVSGTWDVRKEIEDALKKAYQQGYNDGVESHELSPDEQMVAMRVRVGKHIKKIDDLSSKIQQVTREIRAHKENP